MFYDPCMSKIKDIIRSGHVQIAMATGISIIVMAYVSKRVLPEPIPYLHLAIPPFMMTIYEGLAGNEKYTTYCRAWFWIVAIFVATAIVILMNAL
jgi:hypothetical protein